MNLFIQLFLKKRVTAEAKQFHSFLNFQKRPQKYRYLYVEKYIRKCACIVGGALDYTFYIFIDLYTLKKVNFKQLLELHNKNKEKKSNQKDLYIKKAYRVFKKKRCLKGTPLKKTTHAHTKKREKNGSPIKSIQKEKKQKI